jgi:hypothetical protein
MAQRTAVPACRNHKPLRPVPRATMTATPPTGLRPPSRHRRATDGDARRTETARRAYAASQLRTRQPRASRDDRTEDELTKQLDDTHRRQ